MNTFNSYLTTSVATKEHTNSAMTTNEDSVYDRLLRKEASIALVGLGYVGLPLALEFAKDFKVIGFDINADRINMMKKGEDPSGELSAVDFDNKDIVFTPNASLLEQAEVMIVAVPTPVNADKEPNLTPITSACNTIAKFLRKGNIVVFESTVYPGCTEEICIPILEKVSGLRYKEDFKVGYSPERINPGDKNNTLTSITKIVSGCDTKSEKDIFYIYDHIIEAGIHIAPSIKVAEAAKIVENTQRDVNIALMNELSTCFSKLGINTHDVLKAAGTKWNFLNFYPGLVGGHCIGVDPYYLIHKAKNVDVDLRVIHSSRKINDGMPAHVVDLVEKELSSQGKSMKNSKILVLGTTFKENVTDLRNSKAAEMAQIFKARAGELHIIDPNADKDEMIKYYDLTLSDTFGKDYDAVIYAVNHKEFLTIDWGFMSDVLSDNAIVFDFKKLLGAPKDIAANIRYLTL